MKELQHARTGALLAQKKLCNATWLRHCVSTEDGDEYAALELFSKHILSWYPDGSIRLNSCGYRTHTTKDRLDRYLPSGFRVLQYKPYWYLDTPTGARPFIDRMLITDKGHIKKHSLVAEYDSLNYLDALWLRRRIHEYATTYVKSFCAGRIAFDDMCAKCSEARKHSPHDGERTHALAHITSSTAPATMLHRARQLAYHRDRSFTRWSPAQLGAVIDAGWAHAQLFWRRPKNKKELIAQTELRMTAAQGGALDLRPYDYRVSLRAMLEDHLLAIFSFEAMT